MQVQEIKDYCMSKLGAYEECPFAYDTVFSTFSKKEQKRMLEEL